MWPENSAGLNQGAMIYNLRSGIKGRYSHHKQRDFSMTFKIPIEYNTHSTFQALFGKKPETKI